MLCYAINFAQLINVTGTNGTSRKRVVIDHAYVLGYIKGFLLMQGVYKMFASLLLCSCFIVASIVGQEDDFVLYPVADLSHPEIPYHHGPFLHYYLSIS